MSRSISGQFQVLNNPFFVWLLSDLNVVIVRQQKRIHCVISNPQCRFTVVNLHFDERRLLHKTEKDITTKQRFHSTRMHLVLLQKRVSAAFW